MTVTLPERTLDLLSLIDPDRGHAIVKIANLALGQERKEPFLAEVVEMTPESGVIVVGPNRSLRTIPFLKLIEVTPARFVLALEPGNDFMALEVALMDLLAELPEDQDSERKMIEKLLEQIRVVRRSERGYVAEILLVAKSGD
ncbi:MAG: hypothetical protein KDM64_10900 [Verrucomicrobiae bacterium]|nr:hypothetical protein [Verrucomicrobiae bacterium]